MKRVAIMLALFLFLGAIINVAVAWACAIWTSDEHALEIQLPPNEKHSLHVKLSRLGLEPSFDNQDTRFVTSATRWSEFGVVGEELSRFELDLSKRKLPTGQQQRTEACMKSSGWPFVCFVGARSRVDPMFRRPLGPWRYLSAAALPATSLGIELPIDSWIPLRLIVPGMVVNGACFAAALWFLAAVTGKARRGIRRAQCRCTSCGYDLRGTDHVVCPECGTAASERARRTGFVAQRDS